MVSRSRIQLWYSTLRPSLERIASNTTSSGSTFRYASATAGLFSSAIRQALRSRRFILGYSRRIASFSAARLDWNCWPTRAESSPIRPITLPGLLAFQLSSLPVTSASMSTTTW